jgi:hypothetical protein
MAGAFIVAIALALAIFGRQRGRIGARNDGACGVAGAPEPAVAPNLTGPSWAPTPYGPSAPRKLASRSVAILT